MPAKETKIPTYDGDQATVRHLEDTESGRRLEVTDSDDREWVVILEIPGGTVNVEVTRRDGVPVDLETPEWLTDNLSRMARSA